MRSASQKFLLRSRGRATESWSAGVLANAGCGVVPSLCGLERFLQPMLEQWRNRPWQTDNRVAGKLPARFSARVQDLRNLVISESGNNWRDHYANWNFCCTKLFDGVEATLRRCRARFEHALQRGIERRH